MENKHTPEMMFQFDFDQLARYENGRTPVLLSEEQYRRARACVNACDVIPTDVLEEAGAGTIKESMVRITKQRDELLAALEELNRVSARGFLYDDPARVKARAAIANGKGTNNV